MCVCVCVYTYDYICVNVNLVRNVLPSTITTQLVSSVPCLLVATQRYLPESSGLQSIISNVITPSVWVMV